MWSMVLGYALAQAPTVPPVNPATTTVLRTCLASEPRPVGATPLDGRLLFEVRVKRGRVALVTAIDAVSTASALAPCFERELVGVDWGVRRGTFEVPIDLPAPVDPPAVDAPAAPEPEAP